MSSQKRPWVTPDNSSLLVDLYELTMSDSYLKHGLNQPATFSLFVRELPPNRHFLVCAGLESVLDYLENLHFTQESLNYLDSLNLFSKEFLDYLKKFRFTGEVRAMAEGEIFFPPEPILEVRAPRIEAQLIETFLLNQVNFQTMIASKAARIVLAAQNRNVIDMSPRRDQGTDAALKVARSAYIAGCTGTSNVLAGHLYDIPVYGTMAHSYVMSFDEELSAFRAFASDFPNNTVFLIDTYETLQGARHAIQIARELATKNQNVRAVRIDSGDLIQTSQKVRALLDSENFSKIRILLSGDLNEYKIERLLFQGACVDSIGVGTELGTSYDAPALGGVYKLVEDTQGYRIKLSSGKATLPGRKQTWRIYNQSGQMAYDTLTLADEAAPTSSALPLLQTVMKEGKRVSAPESLSVMRELCAKALKTLPSALCHISRVEASEYEVRLSDALQALQKRSMETKT
jgi:nicotinate phosphoribosyltransferase